MTQPRAHQKYAELSEAFVVDATKAFAPRPLLTVEGVGDRIRAAAFAEVQALAGFLWACETFTDVPADLRAAWLGLVAEEEKHLGWLMARAEALGIDLKERPVSDRLWVALTRCKGAAEFAKVMATAEGAGKTAGARFGEQLAAKDPESARMFAQIAIEEMRHIELAQRFFPAEGAVTL